MMKEGGNEVSEVGLELGGKNGNIIFDEGDFELGVEEGVNGGYLEGGEVWCGG